MAMRFKLFYDLGLSAILQFDDTKLGPFLADASKRESLVEKRASILKEVAQILYETLSNQALANKPADMVGGLHTYLSWVIMRLLGFFSGGYEVIAKRIVLRRTMMASS